jgi:hypothetical protein
MAKDLSSARLRPVVISLYDDTGNFVGQATVSAEWSGIGAVSSNLTQSSSRSHAFTSVQYFNAYARDATASASVQSGSVDLLAGETLQFANLGLIRDGNLTIIRS